MAEKTPAQTAQLAEELLGRWNDLDHTDRIVISAWMTGRYPETFMALTERIAEALNG